MIIDLTSYHSHLSGVLRTLTSIFSIALFDEYEGAFWVSGHFIESLSFEGPDYVSEED
ncbi:NS7a protein [Magpie-robin coronavirus HKU18]|uniref:NS7a protein n=1 Tax=Magpie-robin coronavirus HKU18 TaxID=1159903 RepID=UPI00025719CA|nr:NS7a protein [Magpie-robin coronavirus HKU18]AFD29222.1 NS7a protein [Magpie-robin coronavirus HKU18]